MALDKYKLQGQDIAVQAHVRRVVVESPARWRKYVFEMEIAPSNNSGELVFLTLAGVKVREFRGERQAGTVRAHRMRANAKPWESTLTLPGWDKRRDQTGMYEGCIDEQLVEFIQYPGELMTEMIIHGTDNSYGLTYDGQNFFDTEHSDPDIPDVQSNLITTELSRQGLLEMDALVRSLRKPNGKPAKLKIGEICVASNLRVTAKVLLEKEVMAGGETNEVAHLAPHRVCPELGDGEWFVHCVADDDQGGVQLEHQRPFCFVETEATMATRNEDRTHGAGFHNDEYTYGVTGRFGINYWDWRYMAFSTGTTPANP